MIVAVVVGVSLIVVSTSSGRCIACWKIFHRRKGHIRKPVIEANQRGTIKEAPFAHFVGTRRTNNILNYLFWTLIVAPSELYNIFSFQQDNERYTLNH